MPRFPQKVYTKEQLLNAMKYAKSIRSMARYLNCSTFTLKPFLKAYKDDVTGKPLIELISNQCGKGIPKFLAKTKRKVPDIKRIIEEGLGWESYTPETIKVALLGHKYLYNRCYRCNFAEERIIDHKVPLLLAFKDGNKCNYLLNNLELVCYNCYFLTIGNVFNPDQIRWIEEYSTPKAKPFNWELDRVPEDPKTEWQLNDEQIENMKQLGIWMEEKKNEHDSSKDLISRKIKK